MGGVLSSAVTAPDPEPSPGRLPLLAPEGLDPARRAVYDAVAGGPRASGAGRARLVDAQGRLLGPFNAMLHSPGVGMALQALGAAIRYRGELPDRARELAVLVVAAHWDSEFERWTHEAVARELGLSDEQLAAVRAGEAIVVEDPVEAAVVRATRALAARGDLDETEYADAHAALGDAGLVELTTLVGYYATLALQLRVFRVPTPAADRG